MPYRKVAEFFRAWPWLAIALILITLVFFIAPYQIGLLIWSLSKVALGAYLGYWIHVSLNMAGRHPSELAPGPERNAVLLNRAIIMGATILALGLGV